MHCEKDATEACQYLDVSVEENHDFTIILHNGRIEQGKADEARQRHNYAHYVKDYILVLVFVALEQQRHQ